MTISLGPPALAPLTTGHPASLPPDRQPPAPENTIAPTTESTDMSGPGNNPASDDAAAPPTALQRKIMEILERQAQDLNRV